MTTLAESLSRQAAQLPPDERMELVERILDSLIEPAPQLDALWAREAESRLAAYRNGQLHAVSLAEVLARYRAEPGSR
jgi:putative addiction module component (TIGR02574 family)